jgi:hypothetical protein
MPRLAVIIPLFTALLVVGGVGFAVYVFKPDDIRYESTGIALNAPAPTKHLIAPVD